MIRLIYQMALSHRYLLEQKNFINCLTYYMTAFVENLLFAVEGDMHSINDFQVLLSEDVVMV